MVLRNNTVDYARFYWHTHPRRCWQRKTTATLMRSQRLLRYKNINIDIVLLPLLGRCERSLKFRFCRQLCLALRMPSLPCLRASFFDRFPRGSRARRAPTGVLPCARVCLVPPTSAATPKSKDICWGEETRSFYFVSLLLLREELLVTGSILAFFSLRGSISRPC